MAVQGLIVTVGTTPTVLSATSGFTDQISYNKNGQSLLVQNPSTSVTVYIGGLDVSTSVYGNLLLPNQMISIDLKSGEHLYAVVASGTQNVNVIRSGV